MPRKALALTLLFAGASAIVLRSVRNLLLAAVFAFALVFAASNFKDADRFPWLRRALALQQQASRPPVAFVRKNFPTNFKGRDISGWLALGGLFALWIGLGASAGFLDDKAGRYRSRLARISPPAAAPDEPSSPRAPAVIKKAADIDAAHLGRSELLEIYAQTKLSLEKQKQTRAFLSIDIVDSTGMKLGEDVGIAERDFRQYKHMVEKCLKANHALKAAWTPDGVMICFAATAEAIRAAQSVIVELEAFNREVKAIKRDFAIRAGINAGGVYDDAETPMEEMTDRVIDIAGHMQKHGAVNAVCVSKHAVEPLLKEFPFVAAGREVDGCPVYEWRPGALASA